MSDSLETASVPVGKVARPKITWKQRLIEVSVSIGIMGVLIALLLPARRSSFEAVRRSQCQKNLKQISLALHQYAVEYGALPPACTFDSDGRPLHSWRTLILPFLGEADLYRSIDFSKPWDDPANAEACEKAVKLFRCPSAGQGSNRTTYMAVVAREGCFRLKESRPLAEITDDTGETLMVLEVPIDKAIPWMAPVDADEATIAGLSKASRLSHLFGVYGSMVDGSIQFLDADSPADERRALVSISGNEKALSTAVGRLGK